jgi:signal peptidase I
MDFNFPLLLVLATALTGVIWLLDVVWWRPARRAALASEGGSAPPRDDAAGDGDAPHAMEPKEPLVVEYAKSFFPIILAVLVLRSFVVEPFRIPSGSMLPTLLVGDFILVNKYAYGLRLPVLNTRVVEIGSPQRGDVMVFRYPQDPSVDYIKRVVGLPGDRVSYVNKTIFVNGERVEQQPDGASDQAQCRAFVDGRSCRPPPSVGSRPSAKSSTRSWRVLAAMASGAISRSRRGSTSSWVITATTATTAASGARCPRRTW